MLEAMSCGAFPIQTGTSCADEWIISGETGFIVDLKSPEQIANVIVTSINDEQLLNISAEKNLEVVKIKALSSKIRLISQHFYERSFSFESISGGSRYEF